MKTKLLFYAIQKFKNGIKFNSILSFLIIFFMTVTSFSQSEGISFVCEAPAPYGTIIFNFNDPPAGEINGYSYWTGGTVNISADEFVLLVRNDQSDGKGEDRWEVYTAGANPFPSTPIELSLGDLYFYSYDFNGVSPSCDNDWTSNPQFLGGLCTTLPATCVGGPIEFCDGIDNDGDGEIDEGLDCNNNPDSDGDGVPDTDDVCDGFDDNLDADADSIPDGCDICPGFDDTADADGDLIPDGCEADSDNDGVIDDNDVCPGFDDNADTDGDTIPDGCDTCPNNANADQADLDGDGIGDVCDDDIDGDGVPTVEDCDDYDATVSTATAYYVDSDGDGFGDETNAGTDFCSDPGAGYSLNNDDCDDLELDVYNGAPEICDGLDNNCNGQIDEGIDGCIDGVIIEYCDDKQKKILICHNGKTKCVSINAMDAHLAHGDYLGTCGGSGREAEVLAEEIPTSYDVVSWPNPTNDSFNVKLLTPNSTDRVSLEAFDINGRLIHSNEINGNKDYQFGSQFNSGIYFVRLSQADKTKVVKLIKQ